MASFIAAAAEDEGTPGNGFIGLVFARLFYILRFPTHTVLWNFFSARGALYFPGLFINILFGGLAVERTIFLSKKIRHSVQLPHVKKNV